MPDDFPHQARRMLVFWLGHHPEYTPQWLHKLDVIERFQAGESLPAGPISGPRRAR